MMGLSDTSLGRVSARMVPIRVQFSLSGTKALAAAHSLYGVRGTADDARVPKTVSKLLAA